MFTHLYASQDNSSSLVKNMSGEGKSAKVKARQRLAVGTWVLWQMPAEPPPPQESRKLLRAAERRKDTPPAPWTSLHSICPNMHSASKQPRCSVYHSFLCFSAPYLQGNLTEANTMVTIPDSWKKPRVVKVKRKRLLQGQSKVCFPSNPRFNVRVHWGVKEPKPTSEHSLVKIRRRTPHWTLKLTPLWYRRKQALTMEKKESGRQTLSVKTRKKNRARDWRGSSQDCGCYFIKFILSPGFLLHSKIHYYIRQSMGNYSQSPKSVSLISVNADVEKFIISLFVSIFAKRNSVFWLDGILVQKPCLEVTDCFFWQYSSLIMFIHRSWWVTFTSKVNHWSRRLKAGFFRTDKKAWI